MLRLFQSIFEKGGAAPGNRYPETLVTKAIERAIDGTDPRLRAVPGYERKLRPAVTRAIGHVVALVEGLPPSVEVSGAGYQADPRLALFFISPDHMREVVSADQALRDFLDTREGRVAEHITALLLLQIEERHVLGVETEGGIERRDVPQVTVSFGGRRLLDPAASEEVARRLLRRRAFDHLLGIALGHIITAAKERAELGQARTLLRRKLNVLKSAGWSFEPGEEGHQETPASIEAKVEDIERQLRALGGETGALGVYLDRLIEVLEGAERQLWKESRSLIVDRMGIKREQPSESAPEVSLEELHNAAGRTAIVLPIGIPRGEVRVRGDFVTEAKRYLG
jgi:hypothetical protein